MAYVDLDRFILVFGETEALQLTDRDNTGSVDEDVFDVASNKASSFIDDFLRSVYSVPFVNPVPLTIVNIAEALTRCELYSLDPRESVSEACEKAQEMLEWLKSGKIRLPGLEPLRPLGGATNVYLLRG